MEATNQLKFYSISAAARSLSLGKDAVYKLVADGKLGYLEIGKRKKIPYSELVRFQSESIKRDSIQPPIQAMSKSEINNFLRPQRKLTSSLNGHAILEAIMR